MTAAPAPTTNTAASIVGGVINAIMTGGEDAALTYLAANVPVFATIIGAMIASWALGLIVGPIETYLINNATGIVLSIQTSTEQANVVATATALQIAQASGDQNAINTALSNAKAAYGKLFLWDGTYSSPAA